MIAVMATTAVMAHVASLQRIKVLVAQILVSVSAFGTASSDYKKTFYSVLKSIQHIYSYQSTVLHICGKTVQKQTKIKIDKHVHTPQT